MGIRIPTPYAASTAKTHQGYSDSYVKNGVYHFMGCSVISVNMSLGFNGIASSVSITLVEDSQNGDLFLEPAIPSLWAISLPRGGVGAPIFYEDSANLNPDGFNPLNVPFYFCGICTSWSIISIDAGGRTISITLTDPKEVLTGVQCLLGGFALSQEIGTGSPRYSGVDNIIDVFGYYAYGMESEKNEYGMPWYNIKNAIEATRVRLYDIYFEFYYTGGTFTNAPNFYRIDDETIDLIGLTQKVAQDGGADFVAITRKINSNLAIVEFMAISRTQQDNLTITDVAAFVAEREDIVESAKIGEEFRNEPTSSVIVGGFKNANYLALPSEYVESMHGSVDKTKLFFQEDYNAFPSDIKVRLFGGNTEIIKDPTDGSVLTTEQKNYSVDSGAIFPFWGFTPDDHAYPLIEPVLPLDHLAFTLSDQYHLELNKRLPFIKIDVKSFTVRSVEHRDVFFEGDGTSDERPFAYIADIIRGSSASTVKPDNSYIKGLPLNTEVLRAAAVTDSMYAFFDIYKLYYPDIAEDLGFPGIKSAEIKDMAQKAISAGQKFDLRCLKIQDKLNDWSYLNKYQYIVNSAGRFNKTDPAIQSLQIQQADLGKGMLNFLHLIYELVRQYALDHMGRKWLVCLPRSIIMERIWTGLPVPTRTTKPEIEYRVDDRGFWEYVPDELDGIAYSTYGTPEVSSEEDQVRRKFMAEDGRFSSMVLVRTKPKGNINFNSNGYNAAMLQDYPVSEFRPNKIADQSTERVFVACNVSQLAKRPDLALVETAAAIEFDPTDSNDPILFYSDQADDEFISTKKGIIKYFWYFIKKDNDLRAALKLCADSLGISFGQYASQVVIRWAESLFKMSNYPFLRSHSTEFIMDLEAVVIPLTSTWISYGPWYANYNQAKGMVRVEVDQSLVPWNFTIPSGVGLTPINDGKTAMQRLDEAGFEKLARSIADTQYLNSASITVAGFPEYGPASYLGFNNNLTSISVDFGTGGVKTTYNFATYFARPGTYRKADYDNVSKARVDLREQLPQTDNINLTYNVGYNGTNRFRR
jgi:hypothetical protein